MLGFCWLFAIAVDTVVVEVFKQLPWWEKKGFNTFMIGRGEIAIVTRYENQYDTGRRRYVFNESVE